MSWAVGIIEVYIVALLFVIHLSLLFCKADQCIFDASPALKYLPASSEAFITKMLSVIPVSLTNLQVIAHFLLIGDVILAIGFVLKLVGAVIRHIIGIILLALVICFIIYMITMVDDHTAFMFTFKHKAMDIWNKIKTGADL